MRKETWLEVPCEEARKRLKEIEEDLPPSLMNVEDAAVIRHYDMCQECLNLGLKKILGRSLKCKEALEVWAKNPLPLLIAPQKTIREKLAVEHVHGRRVVINNKVIFHFDACNSSACSKLALFWHNAPLVPGYNAYQEKIQEMSLLIEVFFEEGWSVENLLKIQKERTQVVFLEAKESLAILKQFAPAKLPFIRVMEQIDLWLKIIKNITSHK